MLNFMRPFVLPAARKPARKRICKTGLRKGESIHFLRTQQEAQILPLSVLGMNFGETLQ